MNNRALFPLIVIIIKYQRSRKKETLTNNSSILHIKQRKIPDLVRYHPCESRNSYDLTTVPTK